MTSGKKPPITDFVSGREARTNDAWDNAAGREADERGACAGDSSPGLDDRPTGYVDDRPTGYVGDRTTGYVGDRTTGYADDRAAGYDGAVSVSFGWAGPALRAPAYVEGLSCGGVSNIRENHT